MSVPQSLQGSPRMEAAGPLVMVYLLALLATAGSQKFPAARDVRGAGLLLDVLPITAVAAIAGVAMVRLRRRGVPPARLVVAVGSYLGAGIVGTLGVAHSTAVVMLALDRARVTPFVYSFRLYSLLLLGGLLIATGVMAAMSTAGLARGSRMAWRLSVALWAGVLAVNLPLTPLQGFAVGFSAIAAVSLLLLAATRGRFDAA